MKFDKFGWVVAAALAGAMAASGFQANSTKIGSVDLAKVFNDSEYAKKQNELLRTMGTKRQGVLEYLSTYRAVKTEDAQKFRDLSLKESASQGEKDQLEKLKSDIQADDAKFRALQTKANPTAEDQAALGDYNRRAQQLAALTQRWDGEFSTEVGALQGKLRQEALDRVKASLSDIARAQGYSIVFVSDVAPYSSNDLTADALKAMNAKK